MPSAFINICIYYEENSSKIQTNQESTWRHDSLVNVADFIPLHGRLYAVDSMKINLIEDNDRSGRVSPQAICFFLFHISAYFRMVMIERISAPPEAFSQ